MKFNQILDFLEERKKTIKRYENYDWLSFVKKEKVNIEVPLISVAGTNRKEETASYLEKILENGGYKVGYFSYDYFSCINSISISSKAIDNSTFEDIFNHCYSKIIDTRLSYFEILVLIAITYFNQEKVDIAIIESGLGGEIDATNIPSSKALLDVITDVSLDKTFQLGTSVSEIAYQLSGSIKENSDVLVGEIDEIAFDTINAVSQRKHSSVHKVDRYHFEFYQDPCFVFDYMPYSKLEILSPAKYLLKSASLALEAVKLIRTKFPLSEEAIRKGLLYGGKACRLERHRNIFIDFSHNVDAINECMSSLKLVSKDKNIRVLFATMKDKNIASILPILSKDTKEVILTTFDNKYCKDETDYFLYLADYSYQEDWKMALNNLLLNNKNDLILITGSSLFALEVKKYIEEVLHL